MMNKWLQYFIYSITKKKGLIVEIYFNVHNMVRNAFISKLAHYPIIKLSLLHDRRQSRS